MRLLKYLTLLSCCLYMATPVHAEDKRYHECFSNCKAIMYGKWSDQDTPQGACDYGCQASHWTGTDRGLQMCAEKYARSSVELNQACRYGANRY